MIGRIINWSIKNRLLVVLLTLMLIGWGIYSVMRTPLDAIPDLSDVQVIIKTTYPGQAPRVVEDQVTYPLTTAMLSVPGAVTVRGYSFFNDSYVYVIFADGTDPYWARSRVLEYLSVVSARLPAAARSELGPDATGVGWVYEYALVDRTGKRDLSQLRSIQDWFLKYELQTVKGVSEVATVGGMVKQYQVVVHPDRLRAYNIPLRTIREAIQRANQEVGGSVIEMAEAEYMIKASGYISSLDDLRRVPVTVSENGTPVLLKDIADIRLGPQLRRGVAELNGEGEVVGGIVVMRFGENALTTIDAVKAKLSSLQAGLPEGVTIVPTYDRSSLIIRAVTNLRDKLLLEFILVTLVCAVFLFHLRSSLVVVISLPIGILGAFIIMHAQGINANIMSLGGIAIAIGAMVDATIVMIENVHKHLEHSRDSSVNRWQLISDASREVGPALFFSLLIITLSFLPVFALEAQEGRLFSPLAFTKTYSMAVAAGLSITLVPVLMGFFIKGKIIPESQNPVNRYFMKLYRPVLDMALKYPKQVIAITLAAIVIGLYPLFEIESEFMPALDEGDLLYMPTTFPSLSIGKAQELLQQTDKLIRTVPEVKSVFGKIGRADTATDPAPMTMIETTIQLKPHDEWRKGMDLNKLKQELNRIVNFPSLANTWDPPIKIRIDMLSTGIKSDIGIKIAGPDLKIIQEIGEQIEQVLRPVPGTASIFSERVAGGRYINIDIDRVAASRLGLNIADIQEVISTAIGGMRVSETVEGLERYPINVRYPREVRDSLAKLKELPIVTAAGARIALSEVTKIEIVDGPAMVKSENARPNGWVYIEIEDRGLARYVAQAQKLVKEKLTLPPGYSISWSGQFEYFARALERLSIVVPLTLMIIVLLLYLNFRNLTEVLLILGTLPLALGGGVWLLYLLDYKMSVAVAMGFIALAGVAVETGVVMLLYLNLAWKERLRSGQAVTMASLIEAITEGALLRLRPKLMTVLTIIAGLLPIMLGSGTGSEVMRRIAAPMVGGMVSSTILTLLVLPAVFLLWKRRDLKEDSQP